MAILTRPRSATAWRTWLLVVACLLFVPAAGARAPLLSKVLPNGLEVIVLEDHAVPVVTVELAVRNGSFTEPPELNGLSHLYEHMFFSPNQAMIDGRSDSTDTSRLGISFNGTTREEVVEYYFTTTSPNFRAAAQVLRDSAIEPAFLERAFAREREVVVGEIDRQESNPFGVLGKTLSDMLFYKYPTRKQPGGTRETVRGATTDMMRLIQNRYYVPNNSAVIVAGDVRADLAFSTIEEMFGGWPRRAVDPFVEFPMVEHPPLAGSEAKILTGPVQNIVLEFGWQGPSVGKDDAGTYAADVFSFILSQPDSRFQRALVDSGLAAGVGFGYYTQRNVGPITLLLQTTPDRAHAAIDAVNREISHFADPDYFTDDELQHAKALLEADDLFSREKLSEYVHTVAFWWSSAGTEYFRGYLGRLRAVTRRDIDSYLHRYILGAPRVGVALLSEDALSTSKLKEADLLPGKSS
ncbi:MAG: pitrilysin family protein [Vicinamibacterales bacterium]